MTTKTIPLLLAAYCLQQQPTVTSAWSPSKIDFCGRSVSPSSAQLFTSPIETAEPSTDAPPPKSFGKGVWVPPSQNVAQRKGNKVFAINHPQDLLDFVVEDERLSVGTFVCCRGVATSHCHMSNFFAPSNSNMSHSSPLHSSSVKVYASWCKTCKVFDVRYRKLASQLGDKYDASDATQIAQKGRARFAEMQYDNPANEEMCKLLNATKLPYILLYKGSKGKVDEFQCGPADVQKLIDAVNEFADSEEEIANGAGGAQRKTQTIVPLLNKEDDVPVNATTVEQPSHEDVSTLKEQLAAVYKEKLEIFEVMKAQIEYDKEQMQLLTADLEQQKKEYKALLESKDNEIKNVTNIFTQQRKEYEKEAAELSKQLTDLTAKLAQSKKTITSLELEASFQQKAANAALRETELRTREWEASKAQYERERNSLRKLSGLAVNRVRRGVRSLISRVRGR
jgi:thiol-disulfide isomerase/thioredoxin